MEGSSVRFWFEVMDVDGDGLLTVEDIMTLLHEKADWNHSTKYLPAFEVYWLELCRVDSTTSVKLRDMERSQAGPYCFRTFILMEDV